MTVMLLALILSDSALRADDYRSPEDREIDTRYEPRPRTREWKPGVDGWTIDDRECPALFRHDAEGVGFVTVGPSCDDEEIPYAL